LNYRHGFHAGNFADVLKHVVLTALVDYLARKPAGFCVLDIHAGRGRYDLAAADALRTREFSNGIARIWPYAAEAPPLTRRYLELVQNFNLAQFGSGELAHYPGSPCLVRQQLRVGDRLIACELQPAEHALLDAEFRGDRGVAVHARDGWEALGALLPPREKRGVVLIDPPYEPPLEEVERVLEGLRETQRRFPTGVVALWYPVKERAASLRLMRRVQALGLGEVLVAELCVWPDDTALRLNGSGMLVVNPPWQFDSALAVELEWLWDKLSHERYGRHGVQSVTAR
jgi:23S rRNA (adenine2030-N6)-methyltransferase